MTIIITAIMLAQSILPFLGILATTASAANFFNATECIGGRNETECVAAAGRVSYNSSWCSVRGRGAWIVVTKNMTGRCLPIPVPGPVPGPVTSLNVNVTGEWNGMPPSAPLPQIN